MMVVTHVTVALALTVPVALFEPQLAAATAPAAVVGGLLPDLDLVVGTHRRTLHFPVVGPALAVLAVGVAAAVPTTLTVAVAVALLGFGVHGASDALGAGEELRPWRRTNTDAVYDHVAGRWWQARYVIPYDGSPEDLLVAVVAGAPVLVAYDGPIRWLVAVSLGVAAAYTAFRRRLPPYFERLV